MHAVKFALLGMLWESPRHGYELKTSFEELLGGSWPLNIGQVYSTLSRLERDGCVRSEVVPQEALPDRKVYSITKTGRRDLTEWLREPADGTPLRDELFVKVLIAHRVDGVGAPALIAEQRQRYLSALGDLASLRSSEKLDASTKLIVEGAMLHVEADLKWLELCETEFAREDNL